MNISVVCLFPELISQFVACGVPRIAQQAGKLQVSTENPRDYAKDQHRTVDDRPYGGGPGMVMKVDPLRDALRAAASKLDNPLIIHLSPQGARLDQARVVDLAAAERDLVLLTSRYEGVDERILDGHVDCEISIGDYVLSGGEVGAMVMIDAIARLLPGVLGHELSACQDSFGESGLLDHPHFTRPELVDGVAVPEVLLSGDHKKIAQWRREQSLQRTLERRPDLLETAELSSEDKALLVRLRQRHITD